MRSHTGSGPSLARVREVQNVVLRLQDWAARRDGVLAVALVGSYAYGAPRLDSDVDVVIVCSDVSALSGDPTSLAAVGPDAQVIRRAPWGVMSERRVLRRSVSYPHLDVYSEHVRSTRAMASVARGRSSVRATWVSRPAA